jgi:hypothetical protein
MSDVINSVFVTLIVMLLLALSFFTGEAMSERAFCKNRGGVYSFDFMECMKNETIK